MAEFQYNLTVDEENRVIRLVVEGELNKNEGQMIIRETRKKAVDLELDILCDISQAKIKVTLADWFYLVRNRDIYPSRPAGKTALLINPDSREIYQFFLNVSRNVGFNFKYFFTEEDALDWLSGRD